MKQKSGSRPSAKRKKYMSDYGPLTVKTAVAGAVGYGISRWLLGDSPSSYGNFFGFSTSAPMATALSSAAGTLLQSTVGDAYTPQVLGSTVGGAAVAGAGTAAASYVSGSSNPGMAFLVGAGSNYVSDMVGKRFCSDNRCNWAV